MPLCDRTVILASASESRARLMREAGLEFEILPAEIDEASIRDGMQAEQADYRDIAAMLAELKALRVSRRHLGSLVVGADQVLHCAGVLHTKPGTSEAAALQLRTLAGKTHTLASAVCVARNGDIIWHHVETVEMRMRALSDVLIARYLDAAGPSVLQNAGSYAIEGLGIQLFSAVQGDHFAIQGLPLLPLLAFLRVHGVVP